MKRSPVVAMLCVAVLAAVPMGPAVAWEADTQYRDWRNDPGRRRTLSSAPTHRRPGWRSHTSV
jgi:hypothetical protein